MADLDQLVDKVKSEQGFSDAAWRLYSEAQSSAMASEIEASKLRDIARRAAVLARWFSHEDFPFVEFSAEERRALNDDAHAMVQALKRHGFYPEGWGA